jgi:hypothetical protein
MSYNLREANKIPTSGIDGLITNIATSPNVPKVMGNLAMQWLNSRRIGHAPCLQLVQVPEGSSLATPNGASRADSGIVIAKFDVHPRSAPDSYQL